MILRHRLRKPHSPRPGTPGRGEYQSRLGTDVILVMLAVLLVAVCAIKILNG